MDIKTALDILESAGVLGMMVIILWTGYKGKWYWGKDYQKLESEKNDWRELALRGTTLAEHAVETTQQRVFKNGN
jgi:hypothetical protein